VIFNENEIPTYKLTPDHLDNAGWYVDILYPQLFRWSGDTLLVKSDYTIPPDVFGVTIKRQERYWGLLEK